MINPSEHTYADDPGHGHPDVRTGLRDVSYFLLGNGIIQAAIQWAPRGDGTLLGLLVMDPDRLRKKRDALTLDAGFGLAPTIVSLLAGGTVHQPRAAGLKVHWTSHSGVPAVEAVWTWDGGEVTELFFVPDMTTARLVREVSVSGRADRDSPLKVRTEVGGVMAEAVIDPAALRACFVYTLDRARDKVSLSVAPAVEVGRDASARWARRSVFGFGDAMLDRFCRMSQCQLAGSVSAKGRLDSSIWQYNREWVRDQAFVAIGFLMGGDHETARVILARLLREFVTAEGATMDSSEVRDRDEAELDQNGVLLHALEQYVRWTGDRTLVDEAWDRIVAVAEFPLGADFSHSSSGLLFNSREFWERHRIHGIQPGFELIYQVLVSVGLTAAAALARRTGRTAHAEAWDQAARRLRAAALTHPAHALVSDGALIKRKGLDGTVQVRIDPLPGSLMPEQVPLMGPGAHWLNPDTCTTLPIAMRFVPSGSSLARLTLDRVEPLWNQAWTSGGYGRYHVTSEPDSPGGWPFASLFVARAAIEARVPERAWRVLRWLDGVPGAPAGSWFEYYGERVSPPFPQVGIVPWNWSEMLALLVNHVLGIRPEEAYLRIRPRLLPGLDHLTGTFPLGTGRVDLRIDRDGTRASPLARVRVDGARVVETAADEVVVPAGSNDVAVELVLGGA